MNIFTLLTHDDLTCNISHTVFQLSCILHTVETKIIGLISSYVIETATKPDNVMCCVQGPTRHRSQERDQEMWVQTWTLLPETTSQIGFFTHTNDSDSFMWMFISGSHQAWVERRAWRAWTTWSPWFPWACPSTWASSAWTKWATRTNRDPWIPWTVRERWTAGLCVSERAFHSMGIVQTVCVFILIWS